MGQKNNNVYNLWVKNWISSKTIIIVIIIIIALLIYYLW